MAKSFLERKVEERNKLRSGTAKKSSAGTSSSTVRKAFSGDAYGIASEEERNASRKHMSFLDWKAAERAKEGARIGTPETVTSIPKPATLEALAQQKAQDDFAQRYRPSVNLMTQDEFLRSQNRNQPRTAGYNTYDDYLSKMGQKYGRDFGAGARVTPGQQAARDAERKATITPAAAPAPSAVQPLSKTDYQKLIADYKASHPQGDGTGIRSTTAQEIVQAQENLQRARDNMKKPKEYYTDFEYDEYGTPIEVQRRNENYETEKQLYQKSMMDKAMDYLTAYHASPTMSFGDYAYDPMAVTGNPDHVDPNERFNLDGLSPLRQGQLTAAGAAAPDNPLMRAIASGRDDEDTKRYTFMTDDEKIRYNALYALHGRDTAEQYHNLLTGDINKRIAQEKYDQMHLAENPNSLSSKMGGTGYILGQSFGETVGDIKDNLGEYALGITTPKAKSVSHEVAALMQSNPDLSQTTKIMYDWAGSTGRMLPGLLAGAVAAPIAGVAAAGTATSAVFGLGMAGRAYREAIDSGEDQATATLYATQQGFDEYLTNELLGGIYLRGNSALQRYAKKTGGEAFAQMVSRATKSEPAQRIAQFLFNRVVNGGSEFAQEYVQHFTENWTKAMLDMKDENGNPVEWDFNPVGKEALYEGFLGFINAIILNTPADIMTAARASDITAEDAQAALDAIDKAYLQTEEKTEEQTEEKTAEKTAEKTEVNTEGKTEESTEEIVEGNIEGRTEVKAEEKAEEEGEADTEEEPELGPLAYYTDEDTDKLAKFAKAAKTIVDKESNGGASFLDQAEYVRAYSDWTQSESYIAEGKRRRDEARKAIVEGLEGGFGEEGKKVFSELGTDRSLKAFRAFSAYYNYGFSNRAISEETQRQAHDVLRTDEMKAAMMAGARDAQAHYAPAVTEGISRAADDVRIDGVKAGNIDTSEINMQALTSQQRFRVHYAGALLSKTLGLDVRFIQSTVKDGDYKGINGSFSRRNGRPTITLDVNAGMDSISDWEGDLTDIKTIMPVIAHELTHYMESSSLYREISNLVLNALAEDQGFARGRTLDQIINDERVRLDHSERDKNGNPRVHSNDDAMHELVARACEDMLSGDKRAINAFRHLNPKTQKFIWKHISGVLDNIQSFFEQMLGTYRSSSAEARAIRRNMKEFEQIRGLWQEALGAATEEGVEDSITLAAASTREEYSLRMNEADITDTFLINNRRRVANMQSVKTLKGDEFADRDTPIGEQIIAFYKSVGNKAYNKDVGEIDLTPRSVRDDLNHGLGRVKGMTFRAVPDVIEKGEIVSFEKNWKGRQYDSVGIAAPVDVKKGPLKGEYIVLAMVNVYPDHNRAYLHEAIMINKRGEPVQNSDLALNSKELPSGLSSNIKSILEDIAKYKWEDIETQNSSRFSPEVEAALGSTENMTDADTEGYQTQFSIRQFAQALDFDVVIDPEAENGAGFRIIDPATGKDIKKVLPGHMAGTPMGVMVEQAVQVGTIDRATADKQLKMFADLMNLTLKYDAGTTPMVWEIASSLMYSSVSSVKTNADKQYSTTIDYGTICSKTQALIDVLSKTMVEKGRGLTRDEVLKAYNETANNGLSVPCPVCYVFSRWMGVPSLLETMRQCQIKYGSMSEAEVQSYIKRMLDKYGSSKAIGERKTSLKNSVKTKDASIQKTMLELEQARKAGDEKKTASLEKKLNKLTQESEALIAELDEVEAFNWVTQVLCHQVKKDSDVYKLDPKYHAVPNEILLDLTRSGDFATNPKYAKSWRYRTTRGAGLGKAISPYSGATIGDFLKGNKDRYNQKKGSNPILSKNTKKVREVIRNAVARAKAQNLIGGQRFQSTSDFRAEWGLDYLMTFLECQAAGSQVQLYTKVIEAVDLFASAGAEVNLSIMPLENGIKDGELVFSDVTGISFERALEKTRQYDNVQMILVGISEDHIRLAMADSRISFIIPWHSSGNSKDTLAQLMGSVGEKLTHADDFSDWQNDSVIDKSPEAEAVRKFRLAIIKGELWADKRRGVPKKLTADQQSILDQNEFLSSLYNRFYIDKNSKEYGVKLNGNQSSNIFPYEYWDTSLRIEDADENGRRFVRYCESLGIQPRFSQFAGDTGYWKLLIDRRMYNRDGTYHDPQAIDVTNVKVESIPQAVNSNNYQDQDKIRQATIDTIRAIDAEESGLEPIDSSQEDEDKAQYSVRSDEKYMEAVENRDEDSARRMVRDAAARIPTIAKDDRGRPLHLYHGTPRFGFTVFEDKKHVVPFIYTSSDRTVSAHYAGDQHYAFTRSIGRKYRAGNTVQDIIQNAKTVYGDDYKVMTREQKRATYDRISGEAVKIADKLDEFFGKMPEGTDRPDIVANAESWMGVLFWDFRDSDYRYSFDGDEDGENQVWRENLEENIRHFEESRKLVYEYYQENYDSLSKEEREFFGFLTGNELGDVAIDIMYSLNKAAREEDVLISKNGSIALPEELKERMDLTHEIGAYDLYGDLGDRPFIFDADGAQFWALKVPEMGEGYFSTDQVCKWAQEHGYTSVVMKNIYDYGDMADNYVFFSSSQLKSADPVTYDDNGDVIPLSERFNPEETDIRYSMREDRAFELWQEVEAEMNDEAGRDSIYFVDDADPGAVTPSQAAHMEEMSKTSETVKAMNAALHQAIGEGKHVDVEKFAAEQAKKLRRVYGTDIKKPALAEAIRNLCRKMNAAAQRDANALAVAATNIGHEVMQGIVQVDDSMQKMYPTLRKELKSYRLYLSPKVRSDMAAAYDTYEGFRRRAFGSFTIVGDDNSDSFIHVDQAYAELSEKYPELFPPEVENPSDQMLYLMDVAQDLVGKKVPYTEALGVEGDELDAQAYMIGQEILRDYYNAAGSPAFGGVLDAVRSDLISKHKQEMRETFAKKNQQIRDLRERLKAAEADESERIKKKLELLRNDKNNQLARMQQRYEARLQKMRERRMDQEARTRLLKAAQRLAKLKGGPEFEARKEALIGDLDLIAKGIGKNTQEKLEQYKYEAEQLAAIDENYRELGYEKARRTFDRLSKKRIADMSGTEVARLTEAIVELTYMQQASKRLLDKELSIMAATAGKAAIAQQRRAKGINGRNAIGAFASRYSLNMLNPVRAMARIDGYQEGGVFTKLARALNDGQTKQKMFMMKASKKFNSFLDAHKDLADTWYVNDIDTGFKDEKGNPIYINKGMRISLYLHSLNYQNRNHIARAGIEVPDAELYRKGQYAEAYRYHTRLLLQPTDLKRITSQMTEDEKAFARMAHEFLNVDTKEAINETSLVLNGTMKAMVDNYFPIRNDPNFTMGDITGLVQDGTIEGWNNLKERKEGAAKPVLLEDVAVVLQRQAANTAKYYGLAIPVRDFNKIFKWQETTGGTSVREAVNQTWGKTGIDYITNMLRDIQTGAMGTDGPGERLFAALKSTYAGTVLNWNLGVALKQSASAPLAAIVLDAKSVARAFTPGNFFRKADLDYMDAITPWSYMRRQGMSGTEMGEVYKQKNLVQKSGAWQEFKKRTNFIQAVDVWTTNRLFLATEYYVQDHFPQLEKRSAAYNQKVAELYNEVLQRTQPSYDVMQRNAFLRSNGTLTKVAGMFKTQTFNMGGEMIDAWSRLAAADRMYKNKEISEAKFKKAKKQFGKTAAATVVAQLMLTALGVLAKAFYHNMKKYRDDKGEVTLESIIAQAAYEFATSFAGLFMGGSEAQSVLLAAGGFEKWYDLEYPGISVINDTISRGTEMTNAFQKAMDSGWKADDAAKFREKALRFSMSAAILGRIPADNIYKLANAIYLHCQDIRNGKAGSFDAGDSLFGLSDSNVTKDQYAQRAAAAYAEGDTAAGDAAAALTTEKKLNAAMYGEQGVTEESSKTMVEYVKTGGKAEDFEAGRKLAEELTGAEISGDAAYGYVIDSKDYTPEQKVAWFHTDSNRLKSKAYTAWKDAGGRDWDYIKHRGDLSKFSGDDKQASIVKYIKTQTSDREKQKLLWSLAGYKESTFDKNFK